MSVLVDRKDPFFKNEKLCDDANVYLRMSHCGPAEKESQMEHISFTNGTDGSKVGNSNAATNVLLSKKTSTTADVKWRVFSHKKNSGSVVSQTILFSDGLGTGVAPEKSSFYDGGRVSPFNLNKSSVKEVEEISLESENGLSMTIEEQKAPGREPRFNLRSETVQTEQSSRLAKKNVLRKFKTKQWMQDGSPALVESPEMTKTHLTITNEKPQAKKLVKNDQRSSSLLNSDNLARKEGLQTQDLQKVLKT